MEVTQLMPIVAGAGLAVYMLLQSTLRASGEGSGKFLSWFFPLCLAIAFLLWSVMAGLAEGPFGFWPEHVRNLWGNQIWFDLLLAVGIGWTFIGPHARAQGMNVPFWLVAILVTGSLGFLLMVARLNFLKSRAS